MKQFCTWSTQQHTASFWDNLGKSVKECQIILDFTAAKGDGGGGGDTGHLHLAPVKSSPAHQHSDFSQAGCPSCHPTQCHSIKTWDIFVKKTDPKYYINKTNIQISNVTDQHYVFCSAPAMIWLLAASWSLPCYPEEFHRCPCLPVLHRQAWTSAQSCENLSPIWTASTSASIA